MRRILVLVTLALALAGCADSRSVLVGGSSITATVNNPVGRNELAALENAYGLVLSAAVAYRRLPLCRTGQVETFTNICARRAVVLQLQAYDRQARTALLTARRFVRNNPTLSALSVLSAARSAIDDFRNVASNNGVI